MTQGLFGLITNALLKHYLEQDLQLSLRVRLLPLALRLLTLIEYVVREKLLVAGETLTGLYAGNPKTADGTTHDRTVVERF